MPEKGKVKWFSNVKGYGFLQKEGDTQDIFIHYSVIQGEGYKKLKEDEEVTFDIIQGEKGPQATNVVRNKKPAPAPGQGQAAGAPKEEAGKKK